ncbi:tudor domain-containing protein 1-like [Maniola jurtina]|uniref:tudor domain-containing protein 1-like n=1 Tax=Maniola jurtina TaxID=191418 RepID=UPI001E68C550|nr:tudor domain-containing protein 1-like [Maniola jurtina]XP_045773588.1 tudor domain-containing protein 1-like [Maniola jurtina]XP_045773589.1 tudor domain-containing protein 1-like [Maniola jurtina]
MEELKEIVDSTEKNQLHENSDHWVDITYLVNPHLFYTRLTKNRAAVQKIQAIKPVLKCCSVDVHDIVLFNLERDSENPKYARGEVIDVDQAGDTIKCTLLAIDYGFREKDVPLDQIWKCDKLLSGIPPLAFKCKLANCGPREEDWKKEEIDAFKLFAGDGLAKIVVVKKTVDFLVVTLYNNGELDDVASVLVLTSFTGMGYIRSDLNLIEPKTSKVLKTVTHYNFKKIKTGDTLHVRVLSGKSLAAFYVADVLDYRKYLDECDFLTQLSKQEAPIDETCVKCGAVVCVNDYNDKKYKRGVIKKVYSQNDTALVQLVDLGKEQVFSFGNLRQVPQRYVSMPVVGIFCSVEDNQPRNNVHILLHPGRELLITIIKLGHQFESPNVIKIDRFVL